MSQKRLGISAAILAYSLWGVLGVFWALLHAVPAMDTLAYRIIWSLVTICLVITYQKSWSRLFQITKKLFHSHQLIWIILSSGLISINWFIYIYMVTHHQATEASLGYYIMPLMNVAVAVIFLHERLSRSNLVALAFVSVGVLILTIQTGSLPVNTLLMAASFCFYGLIKKQVPLPATISLALETMFVAPIALVYIMRSPFHIINSGVPLTALTVLSGVITVLPLLLFAVATKNTDFITLGFIQYMNPSIQLLLAVFVLHENFDWHKAIVFVFIWVGILIFVTGSLHKAKKIKQLTSN